MALQIILMAFARLKVPFFIVSSVVSQLLVIIRAYYQDRSSSQPLLSTFWLFIHSFADLAGTISLGQVFQIQIQPETAYGHSKNKYLLACWGPFILKHLGRHGEVTLSSLEENNFWPSVLLTCIVNWAVAFLISIQAFGHNPLGFALPFFIIAGTWKLGERVFALKYGSITELRISTLENPNPEYNIHEDAERLRILEQSGSPATYSLDIGSLYQQTDDESSTSLPEDLIYNACQSFDRHKCIFADSMPADQPNDRDNNFLNQIYDAEQCLRIIEMEANFAYDFFYTKSVVSRKTWVWILRATSIISVFWAFISYVLYDMEEFSGADVKITYLLFVATLVLEMVTAVKSGMSDRSLVQMQLRNGRSWRMVETVIPFLGRRVTSDLNNCSTSFRKVGQYSLLNFCFHDCKSRKWQAVIKFFHLKEIWENYWYSEFVPFEMTFLSEILDILRPKLYTEQLEQYPNARRIAPLGLADWVSITRRVNEMPIISEDDKAIANRIVSRSIDRGFKECVLIWHIATDICHRTSAIPPAGISYLTYANLLSNYMLYLMVVKEATMSSISVVERTTYHAARAEGILFFATMRKGPDSDVNSAYTTLKDDYSTILRHDSGRKHSLLRGGYELAAELESLSTRVGVNDVWKIVFEMWVQLLSFAAISCNGKQHAQLIGTGWQLITVIWFFMAHCGMPNVNHAADPNAIPPHQDRESISIRRRARI